MRPAFRPFVVFFRSISSLVHFHILSEICIVAIVADESSTYGPYYHFSLYLLHKKLFEVIAMLFVEDRENIKIHSKLELRTAI